MKKGYYFSLGISFGMVLILGFILLAGLQPTYAAPQAQAAAGGNLLMTTGGTLANTNNLLWVVKKGDQYTHLALYKVLPNEREMQLLAARNITFDLQIDNHYKNIGLLPEEVKKGVENKNGKKEKRR